jgi:hypothetical protein
MWSFSPVNSFGLRTSSRALPAFEVLQDLVAEGPNLQLVGPPDLVPGGPGRRGASVESGRPWSSQSFRPPFRIRQSWCPNSLNAQNA